MSSYTGRFFAYCSVCKPTDSVKCDYVEYNFIGFKLMFLVCADCYRLIHLAGLARLSAELAAFREQIPQQKDGDA